MCWSQTTPSPLNQVFKYGWCIGPSRGHGTATTLGRYRKLRGTCQYLLHRSNEENQEEPATKSRDSSMWGSGWVFLSHTVQWSVVDTKPPLLNFLLVNHYNPRGPGDVWQFYYTSLQHLLNCTVSSCLMPGEGGGGVSLWVVHHQCLFCAAPGVSGPLPLLSMQKCFATPTTLAAAPHVVWVPS